MHFDITVQYGKELVLLPTHPLYSPSKKTQRHCRVDMTPHLKASQFDLFFSLSRILFTIATDEPALTRAYKDWCHQALQSDGVCVRSYAIALVSMLYNDNKLEFESDDFKIQVVLHYHPSELAVFVDGVDGSGKTTLTKHFLNRDDVHVTYELGSHKLYNIPEPNTKQTILTCRNLSDCAIRDAHYAFAERWHSWSMLGRDCETFILSDRSWISTLFYQALEDTSIVPFVFDEGTRFTNHIYRCGRIPIFVLLTNDPYTTPSTDSLEVHLTEKHILYRMAATGAVDEMTIAQYGLIKPFEGLSYNMLPIVGMHVNKAKRLIERILE